ncbi:penicillin-binding protein 2 [Candidatus Saccharibacteria bacterium]|nr:penicillin-binding protein 2 [Candidatus Saccharibacteria bacterium]MCB9821386.1 penicillin-binding protein 2 [Candidatus Nomurabacteria bacterium]
MNSRTQTANANGRLKLFGLFLVVLGAVFVVRLFYLQIIKGSEYRSAADASQVKSLEIPAKRGDIYAYSGSERVPLVLNERRWLVFADSQFIDDINGLVNRLSEYGIDLSDSQKAQLEDGSRYVVLVKDFNDQQKSQLQAAEFTGIYFQERSVRAYAEDSLAAQVLGFVNADGQGQYGIEELLANELTGTPGKLKAITDSRGIPLAFEESNIDIAPVDGQDVTLTIDVGVQKLVEHAVADEVDRTNARGGTGIVMDADTGAILAMSNYPSFSPAAYNQVEDISLFTNNTISSAIEPGSVMKVLVAATVLDKGLVGTEYEYYDPDQVVLDGSVIRNAIDYGAQTRKIEDILISSLNTGSVHLLQVMGGGEVNQQARTTYYDYLVNHFGLSKLTGVELQNEASGQIFGPNEGYGLNIRYGNMTFGQGLTVTPIQLATAYSSIFNGGTRMKPYIVSAIGQTQTTPVVAQSSVLSPSAIEQLRELMRRMGVHKYGDVQYAGLEISGKTGTGQIANPDGGYYDDQYTGTFAGYIKSSDKTYVIVVTIDRPDVRFAGTDAAAPVWKDVVKGMINTGKVD